MRKTSKPLIALVCTILFFLLPVPSGAQATGESQLGSWWMYFGTNKVSERFSIHTEAQFRYYEMADNFNQLLLRTGLNLHINPTAIATFGYGYIGTDGTFEEAPGDLDSREHRIFEQFILKNVLGKLGIEHRYRLEQRFLQTGLVSDTEHRARYRLQLTVPLGNTLFLNFYDEVFLNLQKEVFGQNRAYAALGVRFSSNSSVQLGYLKNHFPRAHFDRLQLGFFFNPDLSTLFKKP